MDDVTLRLPREDEAAEFLHAHRATTPGAPSFLHFYDEGMPLADYLRVLAAARDGGNLPAGHVPETFLFAFVGPRIVGRVAIRHALTASLERDGGHIGYVVVPEFRRLGHATRMLALALRLAHEELGIDPVLVTCADGNLASIRVIERNGGVLHDTVAGARRHDRVRRYWFHR
jgi:predicted acetyltransferase